MCAHVCVCVHTSLRWLQCVCDSTYCCTGAPRSVLTEVSALGFDSYHILSEGGESRRWVWNVFKWIPFCRHYTHSGSETTCARHHFNLYDRLRGRLTLTKEALNKYILLHSASCWVRACCCSEARVFIFSEPLGSKAHDPGILTRGGVYSWPECTSCSPHGARRQLHLLTSSSVSIAKKKKECLPLAQPPALAPPQNYKPNQILSVLPSRNMSNTPTHAVIKTLFFFF